MKVFKYLIGAILHKIHILYEQYEAKRAIEECADCGKNSFIAYPCRIIGYNRDNKVKYIHLGNDVSIGANATIYATRAHLYIGNKSFSGPNLTIMTGDHPYDIIGSYMLDNKKTEIEKRGGDISKYDADVVIEDDVWMGCNVTILKGVCIGRGSIVSAGSVVTKSFPPYSIIGGVPARLLKKRWETDALIKQHEMLLFKNKNVK